MLNKAGGTGRVWARIKIYSKGYELGFARIYSQGQATGKVSYFSSDNSVARIDGNVVTILRKGTFKIMVIKASPVVVVKNVESTQSDADKEYPDTKFPKNTWGSRSEILLL